MSEVVTESPAAPAAPAAAPSAPAAPAEAGKDPAQTPAASAPAEPQGGEKPDTDDATAKRSTRRFERRIDRLTRQRAEAQAKAELLEKELQQYRQPKSDDSGPRLEQFNDIEKYAEAKAKHEADRRFKEHEAKQRTETQKAAQEKLVRGWEEKSERGAAEFEDYEEVVGELQPTTPWAVALMRAHNGEKIAYHLGKNLKEAERIAALDPIDQFLEIGLLSAKLAAEPPKPKTPSKAPAPIAPLTGTTPAANAEPQDSDDIDTWFKKRQKQVHGR